MPHAVDPLVDCLVFLSAHYGRAKSAEALKAGLAYEKGAMSVTLFMDAAEKNGFRAKSDRHKEVKSILNGALPCIVVLNGDRACVLISKTKKTAHIYQPETDTTTDIALKDLQSDFAGFVIYVRPSAISTARSPDHHDDPDDARRHWFWSLVQKNRGIYGLAMVGAVFINLFALASPLFIMNVYDRVIPNNAIATGWVLGIGALTVFIFDFILRILRGTLIDLASRRIDVVGGRRLYDQVLDMKLAYRPKSSGVFANMMREFDTVREFFTSATLTVFVDLPFSLFFIFIIYALAGPIAFILLAFILATAVIGFVIQLRLKHLVRKANRSAGSKHGVLVETIQGLETLKAIGADGRFRAKYTDLLGENARQGQQSRFWSSLGINFATFLQQTASVIIVLAGMYMVQDQTLTIGGLIAAVILGGRAIAPIGQLANIITKYHQADTGLKTLNQIMHHPTERPEDIQFLHRPDLTGAVSLKNVSFAYPSTDFKVLSDVYFKINAGEKVAIIGPIGSGKSTLSRLMLGLYDAAEGTILYDETDSRQIDPADLRRVAGYISQDVFLFNGTIRDNLTASRPNASEDEILNAAKIAGVHDFVARHPQGYDANVGEGGGALSGGQKQAIALARAILADPKIFICDEPTNAMDSTAEAKFINYMQRDMHGKTLILVTHKPSLLGLVDRVILIDKGTVVMDDKRDVVLKALNNGGAA